MIFAHFTQGFSNLPTDPSTLQNSISVLESSISVLESEIKALESSSVPWERALPWFTTLVAVGVAMELWVIWHDRSEEMQGWGRGIIRPPDRPSTKKFIVEIVSVLLVTGGIVGELWAGVRIESINGVLRSKNGLLRSKNAELRSRSEEIFALVTREAGEANERASENSEEAARLDKEAETERLARARIEAAVAWRSLTEQQKREIGSALSKFSNRTGASVWFYASSTEAEMFAIDIAEALRMGHITTTNPNGVIDMRVGGQWNGSLKSADTGVILQSTRDPSAQELALALVKQLTARGFDAKRQTDPPFDDKVKEPIVWVGVAPRPNGPQGEFKLTATSKSRGRKSVGR